MRLVRFGHEGREKPGIVLKDDLIVDLSTEFEDYDAKFFTENGLEHLHQIVDSAAISSYPTVGLNSVRLGAPVATPGKIICIGLNYTDHAKEFSSPIPEEPVLFMKSPTSTSGPCDNIEIPRGSTKTDWEVELAFVVGKRAKYITREMALEHVAGYMVMNDVSERTFQKERCGQWVKGKSHDTFAPMGPFLATKDEIGDVGNLDMWLDLNGARCQTGNTKKMIFDVTYLVSYISQFMTLLPGDIVSTGTPPGVGGGMKPPRFLRPGDTIEFGIETLGHPKTYLCSGAVAPRQSPHCAIPKGVGRYQALFKPFTYRYL